MFLGKYNLDELKQTLYSGSISDILDKKGYRNQAMSSNIRPVDPKVKLMGTAFTALCTKVYEMPEEPLKNQLYTIEQIKEYDIYCASLDGADTVGFFGELMATGVLGRKGTGALVDGTIRDAAHIIDMKFPCYCTGYRPTTVIGRVDVIKHTVPVDIGGVKVNPGDVIFGDIDGVMCIPRDIAVDVIDTALSLIDDENIVRDLLIKGEPISKVYLKIGAM